MPRSARRLRRPRRHRRELVEELHRDVGANAHRLIVGAFHVNAGLAVIELEMRALGRRRGRSPAMRWRRGRTAGALARRWRWRRHVGASRSGPRGGAAWRGRRRRRGTCLGAGTRAARRRGRRLLGQRRRCGEGCDGAEQDELSHAVVPFVEERESVGKRDGPGTLKPSVRCADRGIPIRETHNVRE